MSDTIKRTPKNLWDAIEDGIDRTNNGIVEPTREVMVANIENHVLDLMRQKFAAAFLLMEDVNNGGASKVVLEDLARKLGVIKS